MASEPAGAEALKVLAGADALATVASASVAAMATCPAAISPMTSSAVRRPAIIAPASTTRERGLAERRDGHPGEGPLASPSGRPEGGVGAALGPGLAGSPLPGEGGRRHRRVIDHCVSTRRGRRSRSTVARQARIRRPPSCRSR